MSLAADGDQPVRCAEGNVEFKYMDWAKHLGFRTGFTNFSETPVFGNNRRLF